MRKNYKIHFILILIVIVFSSSSFYYPEPYNKIPLWLIAGVGLSYPVITLTSIARYRKTPNQQLKSKPTTSIIAKRVEVGTSILLNKIEKVVLIYGIFILFGCFLGGVVYPLIEIMIKS